MNNILIINDDKTFAHSNGELNDTLTILAEEVLTEKEDILQRKSDLDRAMTLGNLEHVKMKIYFEDDASKKMVETTVWGITNERVILKKGVVIPIHRVHKIV